MVTRDVNYGSRRRNIDSADIYKNFQAKGSLSDESLESLRAPTEQYFIVENSQVKKQRYSAFYFYASIPLFIL